jgi:hypothetical protein
VRWVLPPSPNPLPDGGGEFANCVLSYALPWPLPEGGEQNARYIPFQKSRAKSGIATISPGPFPHPVQRDGEKRLRTYTSPAPDLGSAL